MLILSLHVYSISSITEHVMRPRKGREVHTAGLAAAIAATLPVSLAASPHERHLLATASAAAPAPAAATTAIPAGYYDARTPAQRAHSRNPWSPFANAEDKVAKFKQWEADFQVLLDKHRDARAALHEWLGSAVDHISINAAPMHLTNRTVAVLDGRKDQPFVFILKHAMRMLGPGWGLIVFHTFDNEKWWVDQLDIRVGGHGEHVHMQRVDPIKYTQANSLAASPAFYERIPANVETIILMQPDTMTLRSDYLPGAKYGGPSLQHLLTTYAYLGSPWGWCDAAWCRVGGNGGVSMRKRTAMLDLSQEMRCDDWQCKPICMYEHFSVQQEIKMKHVEDTMFAWQLHDHAYKYTAGVSQLPTPDISAWFALEGHDVPGASPYFIHKVWNYMSHLRYGPLMAHTKQYYPEVDTHKRALTSSVADESIAHSSSVRAVLCCCPAVDGQGSARKVQ